MMPIEFKIAICSIIVCFVMMACLAMLDIRPKTEDWITHWLVFGPLAVAGASVIIGIFRHA